MASNGYGKYMRVIGTDIEFNANQVMTYVSSNLGGLISVDPSIRCLTLDGDTPFVSPSVDGAWWYDADRSESSEFLGAIIRKIEGADSALGRSPKAHGMGAGGSSLGPIRSKVRTFKFTADLFATSCRGIEFGQRAIIDALRGPNCGSYGCKLDEIEIWTCCPEDAEDFEPIWKIKNVGLVSGPTEVEAPLDRHRCTMRTFEWTMASESPWLYRDPTTDGEGVFDGPDPEAGCIDVCDWIWEDLEVCGTVSSTGIGETSSIIRINSAGSTFSGKIYVYDTETPETPKYTYELRFIPAGKTLIIDSSTHRVLLEDNLTGEIIPDGGRYLFTDPGQPFRFVSTRGSCPTYQICVVTSPGKSDFEATVEIISVHREL